MHIDKDLLLYIFALIYLFSCFICASAADEKGRNGFTFFFFALVCTPIIGFLAVIAFPCKNPNCDYKEGKKELDDEQRSLRGD